MLAGVGVGSGMPEVPGVAMAQDAMSQDQQAGSGSAALCKYDAAQHSGWAGVRFTLFL